jgi:HlyD family secretion protein
MTWKFIVLPILAAAGIVAAVVTVVKQSTPEVVPPPMVPPSASPFAERVSGSGVVEPSSELIELGAPISGIIESVAVKEGQSVRKGEPLFVIDRRSWQAQLLSAKARVAAAQARFDQAKALPKPETVAQAEARVAQARAAVDDADGRLKRLMAIGEEGAISRNERPTREFELANARARLAEAEANLEFVRKGTYPEDLRVFEAEVEAARAEVATMETELDRAIARSPIDCTVLRIDARPGQYAAAGPGAKTQMVLGSLDPLYVRVDIDELDAWRFSPEGKAVASLRGGKQASFPLVFVRMVPLVQPKKSLTGENAERIDTRVMQAIYSFEDPNAAVLPGQLLDVYIENPNAARTDRSREPAG